MFRQSDNLEMRIYWTWCR